MAGPGDEMAAAAAALGRLRASSADRERAVDALKAAFVQGRLAREEFDARIGQALTSRTYADLAAVTSDIPARLPGPRPAGRPGRARPRRPVGHAVKWGAYGFVTPAVVVAGFALGASSGSVAIMAIALLAFLYLAVWVPTSPDAGAGRVPAGSSRRGRPAPARLRGRGRPPR